LGLGHLLGLRQTLKLKGTYKSQQILKLKGTYKSTKNYRHCLRELNSRPCVIRVNFFFLVK